MEKTLLRHQLGKKGVRLLLLFCLAAGFVLIRASDTHAATAHQGSMSVTPIYQYVGRANDQRTFKCQDPAAALRCYSPQQILSGYDIQRVQDAGIRGKGTTIVIIDAYLNPTIRQDLDTFDTTFGLPAANLNILTPFGSLPYDPTDQVMSSWSGEISLDIESAHAVAPAATIDLVLAKDATDQGIQQVLDYVVDHNLGQVISMSYGESETCVDPTILSEQHRAFQRATAKGITLFASSGDSGAAGSTCDGNSFFQSASSPASDPLVTSVGGTHLTLDTSGTSAKYTSETAWNDAYGASGGGYSTIYSRPFYQYGYNRNRGRGVPDVAYNGDPNGGILIAWSGGVPANVGTFYIFGGTSAGSPQWAAMTSLVASAFGRQGEINPLLYQFVARIEYKQVFHDVTSGNNSVTLADVNGNPVSVQGYNAGPGWDAVTGLGSIDLGNAILGTGRFAWTKN